MSPKSSPEAQYEPRWRDAIPPKAVLVLSASILLLILAGWGLLCFVVGRFWSHSELVRAAIAQDVTGFGGVVVGANAVTVPCSRVVLIRGPEGVGAFIIDGDVCQGDGGVRYRWYFAPHRDGPLIGPDATSSESVVFEQYSRQPIAPGQIQVTDAGGQRRIRCGPLEVEWSLGNHIYLHDSTLELAYTGQEAIETVDPSSPSLIWLSRD